MSTTEQCPNCLDTPPNSDDEIDWIRCDICRQWFHTQCIDEAEDEISKIASYHCRKCAKKHGKSHMKRVLKRARVKIDYVALDQGETFALDKSLHPHVPSFIEFLPEADASEKLNPYIDVLHSDELTKQFVLGTGLQKPVLIPNVDCDAVGMKLPYDRQDITVSKIADLVGEDEPIEVMDVLSQQSESPTWKLKQWHKYFYMKEKDRIRNVISLEVSDVKGLGDEFIRPKMVRDLDMVDKVWTDEEEPRPKVTVYCLMSVAGSYTDFHIDFSGTPVYYTICHGSKTFLMYPPTETNLQLYTSWCKEPQQNFTWFPEYSIKSRGKILKPAGGFKVNLKKGSLFIIPSGWIHSVHTPDDSVIIGGNYLTLADVPMHLRIYNLERDTGVPAKYRFPKFNKVLWLASCYYFEHKDELYQDLGEEESVQKEKSKRVLSSLVTQLKDHLELSKTKPVAKKSIPSAQLPCAPAHHINNIEAWVEQL